MDKIRNRLSTFRRNPETLTLSSTPYAAPETIQNVPSSLLPRHSPPESKSTSSPRGPPSVFTADSLPAERHSHRNSSPLSAEYDAAHFVIGGGVAIFHIATSRVVLCWHTRDRYWFLPKGRRDVNEESGPGAEREGFEESGYRNRLLPLPISHRQPASAGISVPLPSLSAEESSLPTEPPSHSVTVGQPSSMHTKLPSPLRPSPPSVYATEPILTQLLPVTRTRQYLLHWYIAETLPSAAEAQVNAAVKQCAREWGLRDGDVYVRPPAWPSGLSLKARVEQDYVEGIGSESTAADTAATDAEPHEKPLSMGKNGSNPPAHPTAYEPLRHPNTAVDAEEALYDSALIPVEDAVRLLEGSGMEMVVRWGWEAICRRWDREVEDEVK